MWRNLFERLNDPHLVAKFQRFFGVEQKIHPAEPERRENDTDDDDAIALGRYNSKLIYPSSLLNDSDDQLAHPYNLRSRKSYHTRSRSDCSASSSSPDTSSQNDKDYTVRWSFFYYLFHIGAGLGNEMFYCCFFPYWFWNVDGYVCRRLVLTWCIIMYIGQALKDVVR